MGARLTWILTGVAENGDCPECLNPTATVYPDHWECDYCDADGRLPDVPGW